MHTSLFVVLPNIATVTFMQQIQGGIENAACASGFYVNWWKHGQGAKEHKAPWVLDSNQTKYTVETSGQDLFAEELVFQVYLLQRGLAHGKEGLIISCEFVQS